MLRIFAAGKMKYTNALFILGKWVFIVKFDALMSAYLSKLTFVLQFEDATQRITKYSRHFETYTIRFPLVLSLF